MKRKKRKCHYHKSKEKNIYGMQRYHFVAFLMNLIIFILALFHWDGWKCYLNFMGH